MIWMMVLWCIVVVLLLRFSWQVLDAMFEETFDPVMVVFSLAGVYLCVAPFFTWGLAGVLGYFGRVPYWLQMEEARSASLRAYPIFVFFVVGCFLYTDDRVPYRFRQTYAVVAILGIVGAFLAHILPL